MKKGTRKRLMKELSKTLLEDQHEALVSALPLAPSAGAEGRGSTSTFNKVVLPTGDPQSFFESKRLEAIRQPHHRNAVRRIRSGQVDCAVQRRRRGSNESPTCPRCAVVDDAEHVVFECPLNQASRTAILDAIRVQAGKDSRLRRQLRNADGPSILRATLGARLPTVPRAEAAEAQKSLMGFAGPLWAREFQDKLL